MATGTDSAFLWPPGTVRLKQDLQQSNGDDAVILQPQPTRDPNDPLNWASWRKHLNFGLVCFYVLMVFALIDSATVTWGPMNKELGFSFVLFNNLYAAGCGGLAVGGLLIIPFALKYGRRPIYLVSTAIQLGLSIWYAKVQTVADLVISGMLSNLVGALCEVMAQMTIADIYFVHQRGVMNAIYIMIQAIGATAAPAAAGYITVYQGWRWLWWWMAIFFGCGLVAFLFLYEETKFCAAAQTQVILKDELGTAVNDLALKDLEMVPQTQETGYQLTAISIDPSLPKKSYRQRLAFLNASPGTFSELIKHMYQPLCMLLYFPAVLYVSILYGFMTACLTVSVTTYSYWMTLPPYNFTAIGIGLIGLPIFVGTILATFICGPLSDFHIIYLSKKNGGVYEPEMRLWVILMFAPFVPAGLLLFGIGLSHGLPWPVLAVGLGLVGFGATPAMSIGLTYLTDSYTVAIADSMLGVTFIRNVVSTIFVFALTPWTKAIGLAGFYIAFSAITTTVLLVSLIFVYFGKMFRVKSTARYASVARKQMGQREM